MAQPCTRDSDNSPNSKTTSKLDHLTNGDGEPSTPPLAKRSHAIGFLRQRRKRSHDSADGMESSSAETSTLLEPTNRTNSSSGGTGAEDARGTWLSQPSLPKDRVTDAGSTLLSQLSLRDRGIDHLHRTFDLPDNENLVDDYLCALRKRILLQGRMYVFEHHLAFYANIFGYVKTKCIPFSQVVAIKKRKNYGFPNSIEVVWHGGKREFFTSFLSRDDAFDLLLYLWHQDSAYAKLFTGDLPSQRLPKAISRKSDTMSSKMSTASAPADLTTPKFDRIPSAPAAMHSSSADRPSSSTRRRKASVTATLKHVPEDSGTVHFTADSSAEVPATPTTTTALRSPFSSSQCVSPPEPSSVESTNVGRGSTLFQLSVTAPDDEAGNDSEEDGVAEDSSLPECLCSPAPPRPPDMTTVLETDLPLTVRDFVSRFLSDEDAFYARFHQDGGDKEVHLSTWRRHPVMGHVRDLNFVANLRGKSALGPAEALCNQTQRYCMYAGDHLVFETRQLMPEIPYGESFSVEIRWDVEPTEQGCHVVMSVRIPFSRHVIWRKAIERSVRDQTATSMKQLVATMQSQLEEEQVQAPEEAPEDSAVSISETRSTELASLVARLPEEYRQDVMRMLDLSMQQLDTPSNGRAEWPHVTLARQRLSVAYEAAARKLKGVASAARSVAALPQPFWNVLMGVLVLMLIGLHMVLLVKLHTAQSRCALQSEQLQVLLQRVAAAADS